MKPSKCFNKECPVYDEDWSGNCRDLATLLEDCKNFLKESEAPTLDGGGELSTDKYIACNHHHEIGEDHELVDFGDGELVANKAAIPLLKALNEVGLRTRTHHYDGGEDGFISILLEDGVFIEIKTVQEKDADRTKYNGKKELLIQWSSI